MESGHRFAVIQRSPVNPALQQFPNLTSLDGLRAAELSASLRATFPNEGESAYTDWLLQQPHHHLSRWREDGTALAATVETDIRRLAWLPDNFAYLQTQLQQHFNIDAMPIPSDLRQAAKRLPRGVSQDIDAFTHGIGARISEILEGLNEDGVSAIIQPSTYDTKLEFTGKIGRLLLELAKASTELRTQRLPKLLDLFQGLLSEYSKIHNGGNQLVGTEGNSDALRDIVKLQGRDVTKFLKAFEQRNGQSNPILDNLMRARQALKQLLLKEPGHIGLEPQNGIGVQELQIDLFLCGRAIDVLLGTPSYQDWPTDQVPAEFLNRDDLFEYLVLTIAEQLKHMSNSLAGHRYNLFDSKPVFDDLAAIDVMNSPLARVEVVVGILCAILESNLNLVKLNRIIAGA